jgi:hypothetical protein
LLGGDVLNDYQQRLTKLLLDKNDYLSYAQARIWVELLWEDFEVTYARAGRPYQGLETTERVVKQWIQQYGEGLHEFVVQNPKYKEYLTQEKYLLN